MNLRGLMKQETTRRLCLIEQLYYAKDLLSSEQLMEVLNCSLPALISDIRFLNEETLPIKIKKKKGLYSIEFDQFATIDIVYAYILRTSLEFQVIECLFFEKSRGIQIAADHLNCSFSNMQRYLKNIKHKLATWDISVHHRPLRVAGDEAILRQFYYLFFREARMAFVDYGFSKELLNSVDYLLRQLLKENQIDNNMNVHFQLMHSFLIGLQRLKNGHSMKKLSNESGLKLPAFDQLERLTKLIKRETGIDFTESSLKECLWPLFSHQLILNRQQQLFAIQKNTRLANFYESHHLLLNRISELLDTPLSQAEIVENLRLLGNSLFCYQPNKQSVEILQETQATMLKLIDKKYSRELRKIRTVVEDFLPSQQHNSFTELYISLLVTSISHLLQRLVAADQPIKVLLLSDTSTTHERFWHSIFPAFIKGAVNYDYFSSPFIQQEQLTNLTKRYDLIVTNVTMTELKSACPLIAINAYPTAQDFERIQQFVNCFEPLPLRKEYYNELTPTS